ncbi:MAG: AraC family transcriptional regulator [Clostridia bacterium]|nr:AraC family transcriptional regulator [Clostridia bacterium]
MIYEQFIAERRQEPTLYYCDRDRQIAAGVRYGPVIRDIYIVECCTEGSGTVVVNGKEFPVTAGDCFLLLPGDTVVHTTSEVRSGVWCAIDGEPIARALAEGGITSESPFAPREAFGGILRIIERMLTMRKDDSAGTEWRRTACIYEILGCLASAKSKQSGHSSVQKALGLMETHYHTPLTVGDIAARVGLERAYFSTLFKAETGSTPHAYLSALRVRKACTLLQETDTSIAAVAEAVGLDMRNFARLFKSETGKTPGAYKKTL